MQADREYFVDTLQKLVRINSINPAFSDGSTSEAEIATWVGKEMERLGMTARRFEAEGVAARYTLMAITMGLYAAGAEDFFAAAPKIYATPSGKLDLGPWQRIFYGEWDGQRKKRVILKAMGE